jgi:hypothetical protein
MMHYDEHDPFLYASLARSTSTLYIDERWQAHILGCIALAKRQATAQL